MPNSAWAGIDPARAELYNINQPGVRNWTLGSTHLTGIRASTAKKTYFMLDRTWRSEEKVKAEYLPTSPKQGVTAIPEII